jgi:hypothetical protein
VGAQATKHAGWGFDGAREHERFGQLVEIPLRWFDIAEGAQAVERTAFWRRRQNRHPAPPIGDLDGFAPFDATQQLAGALPSSRTLTSPPKTTAVETRGR